MPLCRSWPIYALLTLGLVRGTWADKPVPANTARAGNCTTKQDTQHADKHCLDDLVQRLVRLGEMYKTACYSGKTCCSAPAVSKQYQVDAKLICQKGENEEVACCPQFVVSPDKPGFCVLNGKPVCGLELKLKQANDDSVQIDMEISWVGLEPVDIGNGAQAVPFGLSKAQSKLRLGQPTKVPLHKSKRTVKSLIA